MVSRSPPLYSVVLTDLIGDWKALAIRLREVFPEMSLIELKQFAQHLPRVIGDNLEWEDARTLTHGLRNAGGAVWIYDDKGNIAYENYFEVKPDRPPRPYPG